jgi:hypothetical protein
MTLPLVVGVVAFLVSYMIILGIPPYSIGLIIIFGLLFKHFALYGGFTAVLLTVGYYLPAIWGIIISALVAVTGFVLAYGMVRHDQIDVHFRLALFVAGITAVSVQTVRFLTERNRK